jgi:hypothetical protein
MTTHNRLALAAMISAALALTACGGGGGDSGGASSNGGGTPVANSVTYSYSTDTPFEETDVVNAAAGASEPAFAVVKSTLTIQDGVATNLDEYPIKTANYQPDPTDAHSIFVTSDAIYVGDSAINPQKIAFVEQFDNQKFVAVPYNTQQNKNLKFSTTHQKVDLSGRLIRDILFVADNHPLVAPLQESNATFPAGSTCYHTTVSSNNQDVLAMTDEVIANKTLAQWVLEAQRQGAVVVQQQWMGVNWAKATYSVMGTQYSAHVAVYNNQLHAAGFLPKGVTDDVNAEIADLKEELKDFPNDVSLLAQIKALENDCEGFNATAAQAVDALIAQVKTTK